MLNIFQMFKFPISFKILKELVNVDMWRRLFQNLTGPTQQIQINSMIWDTLSALKWTVLGA